MFKSTDMTMFLAAQIPATIEWELVIKISKQLKNFNLYNKIFN